MLEKLRKIIPDPQRVVVEDIEEKYLTDTLGRLKGTAAALVFPVSTEEVAAVMRLAWEENLPVTPRGAGTNLVGSTVPHGQGIILDLSRMNRILEVDEATFTATVEPGVVLQDFQAYVEARGLFYPPDPGEKTATIAGNIATNAGGMRAVKYGVTRDYVRGLEVVLADGRVMTVGSKNVKDASGLALAGVGVAAKPMGEDGFAVIQGDRQYVRSEIDYGGYPAITVQAGIPVEWTIHAEESRLNGCNNEIVVPAYGLTIPLSAGDNVVEFTPTASGAIPYTCWMGMIHGSIYVVDSLEDTDAVQSLIEQADPGEVAIIDAGVNGASDLVGCCASVLAGASDAGFDSAAYSGGCCGAATAVDSETVPETSAAIDGCCIP